MVLIRQYSVNGLPVTAAQFAEVIAEFIAAGWTFRPAVTEEVSRGE